MFFWAKQVQKAVWIYKSRFNQLLKEVPAYCFTSLPLPQNSMVGLQRELLQVLLLSTSWVWEGQRDLALKAVLTAVATADDNSSTCSGESSPLIFQLNELECSKRLSARRVFSSFSAAAARRLYMHSKLRMRKHYNNIEI